MKSTIKEEFFNGLQPLKSIPSHVALSVRLETSDHLRKVAQLTSWLAAAGVRHVTIYEFSGTRLLHEPS